MRKLILAALLGATLTLSACSVVAPVNEGLTATQKEQLTPQQRLFVAEADYLINKADFLAYARQPLCTPQLVVGCHDAAVVKEMAALDKKVREAFRVARGAGDADIASKAAAARSLLAQFAAQVALIALKEG